MLRKIARTYDGGTNVTVGITNIPTPKFGKSVC